MRIPRKVQLIARWAVLMGALLIGVSLPPPQAPQKALAAAQVSPSASPTATAAATPATTPEGALTVGVEATPSPTPCSNAIMLGSWSLSRLAEQTIVVPVDESNVLLVRNEVAAGAGGVILFGASAPTNLGASLQSLDAAAPGGIAPFIMTDEEGGVVQRMANLVGWIPSARQMGATLSPAQIQQLATGAAQRMRANGITMDLAPVLDVDGGAGPNNIDADGTRSFSVNPTIAANDGVAFAQGLLAGGIIPVVKHFPGLGGTYGNTDVTAAATPSWAALQGAGLLPFEAAVNAHVPAVMIANATVPGLTSLPASISPAVMTDVLRNRLGFQGLIITDSLSAVAITSAGYNIPQATVAALRAGADMVLHNALPGQVAGVQDATVGAIVAAVNAGVLPRSTLEGAVGYVLAAKGVNLCA